jgi:hypothetical protein
MIKNTDMYNITNLTLLSDPQADLLSGCMILIIIFILSIFIYLLFAASLILYCIILTIKTYLNIYTANFTHRVLLINPISNDVIITVIENTKRNNRVEIAEFNV